MVARDKINAALQNDGPELAEFFDRYHRKTPIEGEKKLMLAILEDAVLCFLQKTRRLEGPKNSDSEEAKRWIFDKTDDGPFSFQRICEALELDPTWVQKRLAQTKRKKGDIYAVKRSPKG